MLKKTSRYKLNKLISETPEKDIQFALDVNSRNLTSVTSDLKKIAAEESMTVIVIPNKSKTGIL